MGEIMNVENISKNQPLIPYIELDGRYAKCSRCWNEVLPSQNTCSHCGQIQDWSWFGSGLKGKLEC